MYHVKIVSYEHEPKIFRDIDPGFTPPIDPEKIVDVDPGIVGPQTLLYNPDEDTGVPSDLVLKCSPDEDEYGCECEPWWNPGPLPPYCPSNAIPLEG